VSQSWTLAIPAPAPWLNANQRVDLRRQTPHRRAWRDAANIYAKQAKLPKLDAAHIMAMLHFTDRIRRDPHNYMPTVKAVVDGLVDYGLIPDDSSKYLTGPDLRMGEPFDRRMGPGWGVLLLTIGATDPLAAAGYLAEEE
jgi:crossover junction endodeoxyribonuclease RusA